MPAVIFVGVTAAAIILLSRGNLDVLAQIFNFGTLTTYFFINLSLIKLRWDLPDEKRGFRVPAYPLTPRKIYPCANGSRAEMNTYGHQAAS